MRVRKACGAANIVGEGLGRDGGGWGLAECRGSGGRADGDGADEWARGEREDRGCLGGALVGGTGYKGRLMIRGSISELSYEAHVAKAKK